MHARDIMTSPVITARPNSSILDLIGLMLEKHISAIPIETSDGKLAGLVSEGDLIRRSEIGARDYSSWWLAAIGGKLRLADDFVKTHGMKAEEVMTLDVITVTEETPVWQIAEILEKNRIKRVPVVLEGSVVGIVSRANLLQALATRREALSAQPAADDRDLRKKILQTLEKQAWSDISHLNVVVQNGVVYYWGRAGSNTERKALKVAAENIPGVKDVVDHMHKATTLV